MKQVFQLCLQKNGILMKFSYTEIVIVNKYDISLKKKKSYSVVNARQSSSLVLKFSLAHSQCRLVTSVGSLLSSLNSYVFTM